MTNRLLSRLLRRASSTSWATQRAQVCHAHREAERARLEAIYNEFITGSARLFADALSHQKDDVADMVGSAPLSDVCDWSHQ